MSGTITPPQEPSWLGGLLWGRPAVPSAPMAEGEYGPAAPAQPARMGLLDPANDRAAGLFAGLQNFGAQLVAAGRPGGGGWATGLAAGGQAFGQGMAQGRAQARRGALDSATAEANSDKPDDQLSPQARAYRQTLASLPASVRGIFPMLDQAQQAEVITKLAAQRANPRENFITAGGTVFDISTGTPRPVGQGAPTQVSNTSVHIPPTENAFAGAMGRTLAEDATGVITAGRAAGDTERQLAVLERALEGFNSGAFANTRLTVGQIAQQAGIPDRMLPAGMSRDAVASGETIRAVQGQLLTSMLGSGAFPANNFSNTDREFILQTLPGLANTPEGNRRLIDIARAGARRNAEVADAWRQWSMRNGNTAESFQRFQTERLPQIRDRDVLAQFGLPAQPQPPPAPLGGGNLPRVNSLQEAQGLPPGTRFIMPDGRVGTVPGGRRQ